MVVVGVAAALPEVTHLHHRGHLTPVLVLVTLTEHLEEHIPIALIKTILPLITLITQTERHTRHCIHISSQQDIITQLDTIRPRF